MTPSGPRALVLGVAAVVLGAAAHVEAGGTITPSVPAVVVAGVVLAGTAVLSTRPLRVPGTAALLAAGQVGLHLAQGGGSGMHHAMEHAAMPGLSVDMVAAHVVVAVLVAGGIVGADRTLLAAGRHRLGAAVVRLLAPGTPPVLARPATVPSECPPATTADQLITRIHPRRGPPIGACAPSTSPS